MKTPNPDQPIRNTLKHLALAVAVASGLVAGTALAAPANDDFANAINLLGNSGTQTGTDNVDATQETGETVGSGGTNTVWFNWTCPADGALTVTTLGSTNSGPSEWDAVLGIYTGASVNALTPLGTTPQDSVLEESMTIPVTVGTTYYIQLAGYNAEVAANILLNWNFVATIYEAEITAFGTNVAGSSAVIDNTTATEGTVEWTVPFGTGLASLAPTFTLSSGATCDRISGVVPTPDFSSGPLHYIVTAQDSSSTRDYTVTVIVAPQSSDREITAFGTNVAGSSAVIDNTTATEGTVEWTVPFGTGLASLAPTFTLSFGATCDRISGVVPTPDFSSGPLHYIVTAEDGISTRDYTVTVIEAPQLINVNFTGNSPETESTLSGPAGGLGTTWNQYAGPDSSGVVLDSTGTATTATIVTNFGLPNTFDSDAIALPMLRGSMTNFGKGVDDTSVTINGLEEGGFYNIWLVTLRNQPYGGDGTEQYVGWWSTTNATTSPGNQLVNAVSPTINTSTFVDGYNYVLFANVEATVGGQIVFTGVAGELLNGSDDNHRHGLNGLQIEKTTPPVIGIVTDANSTVDASPATVFADGVLTSTVTVTLRDANGNGVPNKDVTLANTGGPLAATINPFTAVTTNGAGQAFFTVSSATPGIEIFTATDVTDTLPLTDTASVTFVEIGVLSDAAQSTVVASPIARLADGLSTSTITVTLRDANGFPVASKDVDLTNSGGNMAATITPPGVVTSDINGQAEFSVSSSTIGAEEFTATDTTDSIAVTQIATVNFIDPDAPKIISVNFAGAAAEVEGTLSGPAGGLGTAWNQLLNVSNASGTLQDSTGTMTTVSISHNYNLFADDDPTTLPILQGSVANFGKGSDSPATVTLSGLASGGSYDIWLVSLRNQGFGGDGTEQYYGTWSTTNATSSSSSQLLDAVDPTINTSTFVAGYNYVLFENVVATGGTIVFTATPADSAPGVTHRLGLNGIQIEEASSTGSPYDIWKSQITNGLVLRTDDADGDGFNNLQEFLLGTSPIAGNGALVTTTASGGNLVLRWLQRESGATYTLKQSPTLEMDSWTTVVPPLPELDGDQTGAPTDYDYYTVTLPTGSGSLFFRIEGVEN